jgi:hypothetical protein
MTRYLPQILHIYSVASRQGQHLKDARAALEKWRADTRTTRYSTLLFGSKAVMPDNVIT